MDDVAAVKSALGDEETNAVRPSTSIDRSAGTSATMSDHMERLLGHLRAINSQELDAECHFIAQIAVIILEYRNGVANERGVAHAKITVDDIVDGMLRGVGISGGLEGLVSIAKEAVVSVRTNGSPGGKSLRRQPPHPNQGD
jgi:hypothetical protein